MDQPLPLVVNLTCAEAFLAVWLSVWQRVSECDQVIKAKAPHLASVVNGLTGWLPLEWAEAHQSYGTVRHAHAGFVTACFSNC